MNNNFLKNKVQEVPKKPGIYLLLNTNNIIIYVGKALNLQSRLKNYFFNKSFSNFKFSHYSDEIVDFNFFVTKTEIEALILEQNLIKKYSPKYNILFKDDKKYPYILITNEKYPRITYTRKYSKNKGYYFGPFPDGTQAREILNLLNRVFPYRKCYVLPKTSCIYYDLKQCLAPCINKVDPNIYNEFLKKIIAFFNGKNDYIMKKLEKKRDFFSMSYQYENAQKYQKLLNSFTNIIEANNVMQFYDNKNRIIVGYYLFKNYLCITLLIFQNGKLLSKISNIFLNFSNINDITETFLFKFFNNNPLPDYLICKKPLFFNNIYDFYHLKKLNISTKYQKLIELANENAKSYLNTKLAIILKNEENLFHIEKKLKELLKINNINVFEIYDNSHFAGENYVSGVNVYKNFRIVNNLSKKYKLNNHITNDISAFEELIKRRFGKHLEIMPEVIFVDGGKAQINVIKKTLLLCGYKDIPIIGLVKDDYHKTSHFVYDNKIIQIKNLPILYNFILAIQNKIHEYTISYFRKKHLNDIFTISLTNIKGVGQKNAHKLIKEFSTIKNIEIASINEINQVINNLTISKNIYNFYNKQK